MPIYIAWTPPPVHLSKDSLGTTEAHVSPPCVNRPKYFPSHLLWEDTVWQEP